MDVKQIGNLTEGASRDNPNRRRIYDTNGLSPTLTSAMGEVGNLQPFVVTERKIDNIYGFDGGNYAGNVYDDKALSPTIRTYQGGNQQPMIVAMRGRNPNNPSDRTAGIPTEQRLEPNSQGICNTLTSVQKDNMVLDAYRIRKLTPLECWRLMGFQDKDFYKAEAVNSNTQLYKQAGNSIVKNVLMAIFGQIMQKEDT